MRRASDAVGRLDEHLESRRPRRSNGSDRDAASAAMRVERRVVGLGDRSGAGSTSSKAPPYGGMAGNAATMAVGRASTNGAAGPARGRRHVGKRPDPLEARRRTVRAAPAIAGERRADVRRRGPSAGRNGIQDRHVRPGRRHRPRPVPAPAESLAARRGIGDPDDDRARRSRSRPWPTRVRWRLMPDRRTPSRRCRTADPAVSARSTTWR